MTGLAFSSEDAVVRIIFAMAGDALSRYGLLIDVPFVAAFAGDGSMLVAEGIFRVSIMIEDNLFPRAIGMAVGAFFAVLTLVGIVFFVTGWACRWSFLSRHWYEVTARARCGLVFSGQRIRGVFVVFERGGLPVSLPVTGFAFLTEDALMVVVFLVAGITVYGSRLVALIRMALLAYGVDVLSDEREPGLVVVERRGIFPVLHRMAGLAGRS